VATERREGRKGKAIKKRISGMRVTAKYVFS